MNTSILAAKEEDSDLTKSIKMKILEYMNTKYDNPATQELLDMTCFMDPRFKANYIISDKVSDSAGQSRRQNILTGGAIPSARGGT